jgi:hypothetical protein
VHERFEVHVFGVDRILISYQASEKSKNQDLPGFSRSENQKNQKRLLQRELPEKFVQTNYWKSK